MTSLAINTQPVSTIWNLTLPLFRTHQQEEEFGVFAS